MPSPLTPAELAGHTLLTIERAAEVTGWSRAALYATVRSGVIPSMKVYVVGTM